MLLAANIGMKVELHPSFPPVLSHKEIMLKQTCSVPKTKTDKKQTNKTDTKITETRELIAIN